MIRHSLSLGVIALFVFLSGCSVFNNEEILPGERTAINMEHGDQGSFGTGQGLPAPYDLDAWTQTNSNPTHAGGHLAGPSGFNEIWSVDIGAGRSGNRELTGAPIVFNGRIYALDAESNLIALDAGTGEEVWDISLAPEGERGKEGFGGGLATDRSMLFASTGFGEILAIDVTAGEILWRTSLGAPVRAAPAVAGGVVIVSARDNRAYGLDAKSGEIVWRLTGASANAGYLGGASAAIQGRIAIVPFASGEIIGVDALQGRRAWTAVLGGARRGFARSSITDVTGDPVIIGQGVITANQAGRIMAVDIRTGQRYWTRTIGSQAAIWAAGDSIYFVSGSGALTRLLTRTGQTVWQTQLPAYEDPDDKEDAIAYSRPVAVGGRLVLSDSTGRLMAFDPDTGNLLDETELSSGSLTGPIITGGTMYVLADNGVLHAYR